MSQSPPPICVLGMHRSGTSMIARMMHMFGADLGGAENTLESQSDNPEGYWENWHVVELNNEILAALGGSWHTPPALEPGWSKNPALDKFRLRAVGALTRFTEGRQWAIKDPRMMLTLEFWQGVIPDMTTILCVRNPFEVAESFAKRVENGLGFTQALELWGKYHDIAFQSLSIEDCLVTNYLSYGYDPLEEVNRIVKVIAAPVSSQVLHSVAETVRLDLYRSAAPQEAVNHATVPRVVQEFYWSLGLKSGDVYHRAQNDPDFERRLSDAAAIRLHEARMKLSQLLDVEKAHTASLRAENQELKGQITDLELFLESLTNEKAGVVDKLSEEKTAEVHLIQRIHQLNQELSAKDAEQAAIRQHLENVTFAHTSIQRSISWRLGCKIVKVANRLAPPGSPQRRLGGKVIRRGRMTPAVQSATKPDGEPVSDPERIAAVDVKGVVLPKSETPVASIVIPVHNQWIHTSRCLLALGKNLPKSIPLEVIVIDDGSSDETSQLLGQVKGLVTSRNESATGFIRASNKGAQLASGQFLVFLNNDTEIQEGWLENLLKVAQSDPKVAIVGSMLIYPDGRLQEAGGIIYDDASGSNFGRDGDPTDPMHTYLRDVDYCSGASLLVNADFFWFAGGFDELYLPAYYEDTDLCFKARREGLRVVYQPLSKVIHYEGATSGTDVTKGIKAYQVANQKKFYERWKEDLKKHQASHGFLVQYPASRRLTGKPTILVIDVTVPRYDHDAGSLRIYNILKFLRELGYGVIFLTTHPDRLEPYTTTLEQLGIEVHACGRDNQVGRDLLRTRLRSCDLVIASRPDVMDRFAPILIEEKARAIVYDTVDLHYIRFQRKFEKGLNEEHDREWQAVKRDELRYCRLAEATITVTENDKVVLEKEGVSNVHVIPTVQELAPETRPGMKQRDGVLFIGGYLHEPNADAAIWLATEIMPYVWKKKPGLRLTLLGSSPPEHLLALESDLIRVPGFKESVEKDFLTHRVFVAPLRFGSGIKGKISQSLYYRLPVVTTSIGAEGMNLSHRKHALIHDDAQAIADAIIELYENQPLWDELAANSNEPLYVQSPEKIKESLQSLVERVLLTARHNP